MSIHHRRVSGAVASAAASALVMTACAGTAGSGGPSGGSSDDAAEAGSPAAAGFAWGAPQEEVDTAIADLEPVTLTYQAGAQSPESTNAAAAHALKEAIEERSGGKITVDVVWGQPIAGYDEVVDALTDGRIDIALTLPILDPAEYPAFDALSTAATGLPNSPVVGEFAVVGALADLGWGSQKILDDYAAQGLTTLIPAVSTGNYLTICRDPGTARDDWKGRQVRISTTAHTKLVDAMGASPVSMAYVEVYEALQRGTIDCSLSAFNSAEEAGLLAVGSEVALPSEEASFRAMASLQAGSRFAELPLAYQQIVFDAAQADLAATSLYLAEANLAGFAQMRDAGGELHALDAEIDAAIVEANRELLAEVEDSGALGSDVGERVAAAAEKWAGVVDELGYVDGGEYAELDEWFDPADYDLGPYSARLFEEVFLPHRPS